MSVLAKSFPQGIFILAGVWVILAGTLLYWPLERMHDRIETSKWCGRDGWSLWNYRFRVWIRSNPRREWIFRSLLIVVGLALIGFGIA